jgi:predicted metal-binding protein
MIDGKDLVAIALESNATQAAIIETSSIQFHEDFRKACEKNFCGKYDTNWMGPPAIGPISALMQRATSYRQGILFQTVHRVASNFDMKGMLEGAKIHNTIFGICWKKSEKSIPERTFFLSTQGAAATAKNAHTWTMSPAGTPTRQFPRSKPMA